MVKIVSLSEEAYDALERLKGSGQSFTEVVLLLAEKERLRRLEGLMGGWKMSAAESEEFTKGIYERRTLSKPRRVSP